MEEQNMNGTATEQQQERTFTQEQVNAIIGERLAKQKQQLEAELVEREQQLTKREMGIRAKELLEENDLPKNLADVLRYDTEEELVKAIETIKVTKGFKERKAEKDERVIIENRLPEYREEHCIDPIREAFKGKVD